MAIAWETVQREQPLLVERLATLRAAGDEAL
jgi:hypothetical protein